MSLSQILGSGRSPFKWALDRSSSYTNNSDTIAKIAIAIEKHGWKSRLTGVVGIQPGKYYRIERETQAYDIGLGEFSDDKPFAVWSTQDERPVFQAINPDAIVDYLINQQKE